MYSASNLHQKNRETKDFIISDYEILDKKMNTSNIIKGIQKPLHRLESIIE